MLMYEPWRNARRESCSRLYGTVVHIAKQLTLACRASQRMNRSRMKYDGGKLCTEVYSIIVTPFVSSPDTVLSI